MAKVVVGMYDSPEEAMKGINIFELKGHQSKNVIALTTVDKAEEVDNLTNITVQTKTLSNDDSHKIKGQNLVENILGNEDVQLDSLEKLIEYGLTPKKAEECVRSVQEGKIVVLADNALRMGQSENIDEYM